MKSGTRHTRASKTAVSASPGRLLLALLLCLLTLSSVAATSYCSAARKSHRAVMHHHNAGEFHFHTNTTPSFPSSAPAPIEREGSSENESDDTNDEVIRIWHSTLERRLSLLSSQTFVLQWDLSTEANSALSLVVLHHSWKSFLA
jgi:hypothetical protein